MACHASKWRNDADAEYGERLRCLLRRLSMRYAMAAISIPITFYRREGATVLYFHDIDTASSRLAHRYGMLSRLYIRYIARTSHGRGYGHLRQLS